MDDHYQVTSHLCVHARVCVVRALTLPMRKLPSAGTMSPSAALVPSCLPDFMAREWRSWQSHPGSHVPRAHSHLCANPGVPDAVPREPLVSLSCGFLGRGSVAVPLAPGFEPVRHSSPGCWDRAGPTPSQTSSDWHFTCLPHTFIPRCPLELSPSCPLLPGTLSCRCVSPLWNMC